MADPKDARFVAKLLGWTAEGQLQWRVRESLGLLGMKFSAWVNGREVVIEAPGMLTNPLSGTGYKIEIMDKQGRHAIHSISNNDQIKRLYKMIHENLVGLDSYLDSVIDSDDPGFQGSP